MARSLKVIAKPAFKNVLRNPYTSLLYTSMLQEDSLIYEYSAPLIISSQWDILHVHWPESFLETNGLCNAAYSFAKHMALIELCRRRGTKIVWTIHDLRPHDLVYRRLESWFWRAFTRRVDAVIALTNAGLALAKSRIEELDRIPAFVIPHGHYRDHYPNVVSRSDARRRLGVPESTTLITYVGQLRPYKNAATLIKVFRQLSYPNAMLFICGRLSKRVNVEADLRAAAGDDPRVRLHLHHIPDDEMQIYCNAADLMVFPYNDILNSGSAMLALSFNKPILVPHIGSLPELQQVVGPAWVMTYQGTLTARVLDEALVWAHAAERGPVPPLSAFEWRTIAGQTVEAFRQVLMPPGQPSRFGRPT